MLLFIPHGLAEPEGGYWITRRPSVRPSVPSSTAKTVGARHLQFWSQLCISDAPTRFFQIFEKIQNGRLLSKKHAKIATFWAKSVSRCPAKMAAYNLFIFCELLVPYIVMMHDFSECWKFSRWPTEGKFKNITTNIYFGLYLKNHYR